MLAPDSAHETGQVHSEGASLPPALSRHALGPAVAAAGLLIAQQVAAKATRDALFLTHFPVTVLPAMSGAAALLSLVATLAFARGMVSLTPSRMVPLAVATSGALLVAEWAVCGPLPRVAAVAVYLHVAVFGAPLFSGLWSLINERYDPYSAKRAVGAISTGASVGGLLGGLIAWWAASMISVRGMLLVLAALGLLSLPPLLRLRGGSVARAPQSPGAEREAATGLRLILSTPYVRNLALLVGVVALSEALLDYLLSASAAESFGPGGPLMSFFARFQLASAGLSLALQAALTRPALLRLGLAGTLAIQPGLALSCGVLALALPRLWSTVLLRATQAAARNSMFRPAYELLYIPLSEESKRSTKVIVDVGCDRLGTILGAGIVAAALATRLAEPRTVLMVLVLVLAGLGLALALRSRTGYVRSLAESLRSGMLTLDAEEVVDGTTRHEIARLERERLVGATESRIGAAAVPPLPEPADPLLRATAELRSGDRERIGAVLGAGGAPLDPRLAGHVIPLLGRDDLFGDVVRSLRKAAPLCTGQLLDALLDPAQDPVVRRRIPRVLKALPTQRVADGLLLGLRDERADLRYRCAQALVQIRELAPLILIPQEQVVAAAVREIKEAGNSRRRLDQVFLILALVLEREPLEIALRAVRTGDEALRGTALEYLDNVLPEPVRKGLWQQLSSEERPRASGRSTEEMREDLLRSTAVRRERRSRSLRRVDVPGTGDRGL